MLEAWKINVQQGMKRQEEDELMREIGESRCVGMVRKSAGAKVILDFWLWVIAKDHHDVFSRHVLTLNSLAVAS